MYVWIYECSLSLFLSFYVSFHNLERVGCSHGPQITEGEDRGLPRILPFLLSLSFSILLNGKPICEHFSSQRSRRLIPWVSGLDTHLLPSPIVTFSLSFSPPSQCHYSHTPNSYFFPTSSRAISLSLDSSYEHEYEHRVTSTQSSLVLPNTYVIHTNLDLLHMYMHTYQLDYRNICSPHLVPCLPENIMRDVSDTNVNIICACQVNWSTQYV